tara:strand:+ start:1806 stop:2783 length:978 start_codon:yes stop_codon:yes gene_type:complete
MELVQASDGVWLPDIAGMVRDRLENPGPLLTQHDTAKIGSIVLRQLETRGSSSGLRLSAAGKCLRALGYDHHHWNPNGHEMDAASILTFSIGDITEQVLVAATREAFAAADEYIELFNAGADQETVFVDVVLDGQRTLRVPGHPDGCLKVKHNEETIDCLFELKSMSDYGFKMFRNKGLDASDSYYSQIQAYMLAKEQMTGRPFEWAYVMAFGKTVTAMDAVMDDDTGKWWRLFPIVGQWLPVDREHQEYLMDRFKLINMSSSVEDIPRPYKPVSKGKYEGKLKFPCDYCNYFRHCYPGATSVAEESKWLQKTTKVRVYAPKEEK